MVLSHPAITGEDAGMQFGRALVTGGLGEVGGFLAQLLAAEPAVSLVDPLGTVGSAVVARDVRTPCPALTSKLAGADVVVLALPETVALQAVPVLAPLMRPGALLLHTLSVKSQVMPLLAREATRHGPAAISLRPMFAPSLGARGRPVALVEVVPGKAADHMCAGSSHLRQATLQKLPGAFHRDPDR